MSQLLTAEIGKRIARYRKLNGWSAQRLADNTNGALSRATIASIESGRRANIRLDQFLTLCLALRIPPFALLVDLEHPFAPTELRFPGTAPSPLDEQAPNIAVARWLRGQADTRTTPAAHRVAQLGDLTDSYLVERDALEAHLAVARLHPNCSTDPPSQLLADLRTAGQRLADEGVPVPHEPATDDRGKR